MIRSVNSDEQWSGVPGIKSTNASMHFMEYLVPANKMNKIEPSFVNFVKRQITI